VPLSACLTIIEKADNIKNYLYDVLAVAEAVLLPKKYAVKALDFSG
jgi:hypothetical protein